MDMMHTAIVAHPSRLDRAEAFRKEFGGELFVDMKGRGHRANHLDALKFLVYYVAPTERHWGVVFEDDAEPVTDFTHEYGFREEVRDALNAAPTPVVSFYLGRCRPPQWQASIASVIAREEHWLLADEMLHAVGYAIRGDKLMRLLQAIRYEDGAIDEVIGRWCRRNGIQVSYSHPSLVDHADHLPSLIPEHETGHRGRFVSFPYDDRIPRRAWVTGSRGLDAWNSSAVQIPDPLPILEEDTPGS